MSSNSQIRRARQGERGYIMMTLLLTMALMIIFAAIIVPSITFDIKRDREEEMIHRGTQYSRAIRLYYRKFGRYPMRMEDLENSSRMRFLRKRYKDPITGKDFRLLHYGEAKLSINGMGGGVIPGASSVGANGALVNSSTVSTFGANTGFATGSNSAFGSNSGFGQTSNSAFGQSSQGATNQTTAGATGSNTSASGASGSGTDQTSAGNTTGSSGDSLSGKTFGGAPIVGVASLSKNPTIREFDHKKKYNEWQFVYDPTFDRGFLITTPYQPSIQALGIQGMTTLNGPNQGQNGTNNNGFGNSFGTGFGNSPAPMQNQPTSPVSPPVNSPQQQ
jgi:type II secretory pathway pseudopilin PulG